MRYRTHTTTLSVAWVPANPAITSVILGASRVEQLTDTLAAADYELDSALVAPVTGKTKTVAVIP